MSDDSSNNDGFVVRSRPDAGIVVETRPLTPAERAALDVGEFFTRTSAERAVGEFFMLDPHAVSAVVRYELTAAECDTLLTPYPTLGRTMLDCAGLLALAVAIAALDLILLPWGYAAAAYLSIAVTMAVQPVTLWRRRVHDWQRARDAVAASLARRGTT